jgi:hypothetical protein
MVRRKGFWISPPVGGNGWTSESVVRGCAVAAPNHPLHLTGAAITVLRDS